MLGIAVHGEVLNVSHSAMTLLHEASEGILLGALLGGVLFTLLRSANYYQVEVLLRLVGVVGGYELASSRHMTMLAWHLF